MKYILDHNEEFERLQRQNHDPEFDPLSDLVRFQLGAPKAILDAGCGSGALTRTLRRLHPSAEITGVDASKHRIDSLNADSQSQGIKFVNGDLQSLGFENESFDTIFVRYVLQHMPSHTVLQVLKELFRCLKPGGKLYMIDVDGYLETLYPMPALTRKALDLVKESQILDLEVARKLPHFAAQTGFQSIDWQVVTTSFQGAAQKREVIRTAERFDCAKDAFLQLGLTESEFIQLKREITETLAGKTSVCLMNQFYITAVRPYSLSIVK